MKIMVIDTQGAYISDAYRAMLPGISIRGIEPGLSSVRGSQCHEHGALCGWLAALPLAASKIPAELVFVRIFDRMAKPIKVDDDWLYSVVAAERPDYVSRSWGMWDGDDALMRYWGVVVYEDWAIQWRKLQAEIGFTDFGAAGNSDNMDRDEDVDYPQCLMPDITNIIGACRRDGVPTEWTGDGPGVECLMWGDMVHSLDMSGRWRVWSGTSAATPKACGAAAALGLDNDDWRAKVLAEATRPAGLENKAPHPKWGYGCMEEAWQKLAKKRPALLPSKKQVVRGHLTPEFFEFKRL